MLQASVHGRGVGPIGQLTAAAGDYGFEFSHRNRSSRSSGEGNGGTTEGGNRLQLQRLG